MADNKQQNWLDAGGRAIAEALGLRAGKDGRYPLPGGPKTAEGLLRTVWRALDETTTRQSGTVVVDVFAGMVIKIDTPHHVGVLVRSYDDADHPRAEADENGDMHTTKTFLHNLPHGVM